MSFLTEIFTITIVYRNEPMGARLFKIELQLPMIQLISGDAYIWCSIPCNQNNTERLERIGFSVSLKKKSYAPLSYYLIILLFKTVNARSAAPLV